LVLQTILETLKATHRTRIEMSGGKIRFCV
jgi:hypothetical protein